MLGIAVTEPMLARRAKNTVVKAKNIVILQPIVG